jgi:HD superfamily phosphohydrolase
MPGTGLTSAMQGSEPWGLDRWWLVPEKVVTDPIHGDIYTTRLEQRVVDAPAFQRLRRIRQLHTAHLVYPGATHSRFSHALGTLSVAQVLMDRVLEQRHGHHAVPDLFGEWAPPDDQAPADGGDDELATLDVTADTEARREYLRRITEATVLARLGALLHDFCHVPFGHLVEDDLGLLDGHDVNTRRFGELWDELLAAVEVRLRVRDGHSATEALALLAPMREGSRLHRHLRPLILAGELADRRERNARDPEVRLPPIPDGSLDPTSAEYEYPFVADIVGNTICADLLDYLQRDHRFSGLPISLGQRYLSAFYVVPDELGGLFRRRMALLVHRNGRRREDVITEVLKHLRYRYELQERVIAHHTKLAADAMVGRMLERLASAYAAMRPDDRPSFPRRRKLAQIQTRERRKDLAHSPEREPLEDLLLTHGDDGLIEVLAGLVDNEHPDLQAAGAIAERLLHRDLFVNAANAVDAFAQQEIFDAWGSRERRRELEARAAEWAEVDRNKVIVWVPPPGMRLKLAEVLVDHGRGLSPFKDFSRQGQDVYDAHNRLWTVGLFLDRDVGTDNALAVAAKSAQLMGLCWDGYERRLGPTPSEWPEALAAQRIAGAGRVDRQARELMSDYAEAAGRARGRSGGTEARTLKALEAEMRRFRRTR